MKNYFEMKYPMPVCNHTEGITRRNVGYTQGVLSNGVPFQAEKWKGDDEVNVTFVIPDYCNLLSTSRKQVESKNSNNKIVGYQTSNDYIDYSVLTIGMVYYDWDVTDQQRDAKYYSNTMQTQFETKKIHSNNLYQIFTYVKNMDVKSTGDVSGMLLYAKTQEQITPNNEYSMSGNKIYVKTLDLNMPFESIKEQMEMIGDKLDFDV